MQKTPNPNLTRAFISRLYNNKREARSKMKRSKRLERLGTKLKVYLPIISIFLSIILFYANFLNSQYQAWLAESWRKALSKSMEISSKGGKAYPYETSDGWGVNFQQEANAGITFQVSGTAYFTRRNETISTPNNQIP